MLCFLKKHLKMSPFLAITLLLFKACHSVAAPFGVPLLAPLFGNACQEDVCGRGTCVASNSSNFGFKCQCESGWRQARSEDDDDLSFLPCVVPNCTLDYTCANAAAPPAPGNPNRGNLSFFDPCFWIDCGGGTCNKTSVFSRACLCEEGYYNLFNSSTFPCYHQCSIGADCPNLGLNLTNPTTPDQDTRSTSANDNSTTTSSSSSIAASLIPGVKVAWSVTVLTTFALSAWKNT